MSFKLKTLVVAASTLALCSAAHALTARQVTDIIVQQGYHAPHGLELAAGVWHAKATAPDGKHVKLLVDNASGRLNVADYARPRGSHRRAGAYNRSGASTLSAQQIVAALQRAGYTNIHDLEYDRDDGYWEADARSPRGRKVELHIDPRTGRVLREKRD
ncbi:MAG: PepSY domain-containing protein [Ottowia sp.]|nr:PepSY domain-containing protein [Ottowia sp.]